MTEPGSASLVVALVFHAPSRPSGLRAWLSCHSDWVGIGWHKRPSSPNLVLLTLAKTQLFPNHLLTPLCCEIRMGFTWAVSWGVSPFLCIETISECGLVGYSVRENAWFWQRCLWSKVFSCSFPKQHWQELRVRFILWYFNVVLKQRFFFFKRHDFHLFHSPLLPAAVFCKPLSSHKLARSKACCLFLLSLWNMWTYSVFR